MWHVWNHKQEGDYENVWRSRTATNHRESDRGHGSSQTHRADLRLEHSQAEVQVKDLQEVQDQAGHQAACGDTKLSQDQTERPTEKTAEHLIWTLLLYSFYLYFIYFILILIYLFLSLCCWDQYRIILSHLTSCHTQNIVRILLTTENTETVFIH